GFVPPAEPFYVPWAEGGYRIDPLRPEIGWATAPPEEIVLMKQCEESPKPLFERCWGGGLPGGTITLDGRYGLWAWWTNER
ncbi:MAG: hypothetical protein GYB64_07330, partial [Chloroflexi bacterium]|nr:hypothetical protein [Chloroflexota bacterium]